MRIFCRKVRTVILLISAVTALATIVTAAQQEYFTIMVGSYRAVENAEKDFKVLEESIVPSLIAYLRIEMIGGFYILRVGKFKQKGEAEDLLPVVRRKFKEARVLSAFFRPERIVKTVEESGPSAIERAAFKVIHSRKFKKKVNRVPEPLPVEFKPRPGTVEFYTLQTD